MTLCPPWETAIARLPRRIKWVHHGRDPQTGLDCIGLVLCVYALRGIDITDLDVPYGIRDSRRRAAVVYQRLARKFDPAPLDWLAEGDVLATWCQGAPSHLAIVAGSSVYQMTASGLYRSSIANALLTTERAFRYRE